MTEPPDANWFDAAAAAGGPPPPPFRGDQVGGYGSYSGPPGRHAQQLFDGPAPVLVSFEPATSLSRLTVAFRGILVIPHLVVLWVLNVATEISVVISWFAALFTGRVPEWAHTFVSGVLRWQVRVYAYLYFVTDSYPPFSLEDEPYPVHLVTARTRLNRATVFFRGLLLIPAEIVLFVADLGFGLLAFVGWLVGLITGRLPESMRLAMAAFVRYQARFSGYVFLLTPEYPKGLFGDPTAPDAAVPALSDFPGPAITDPVAGEPIGLGPATAVLAPADQPPAVADPWRLTLTSGARNVVILALVLGALAAVGMVVTNVLLISTAAPRISNAVAATSTEQAYTVLGETVSKFPAKVQACAGNLSCVTAADRQLATEIKNFGGAVQSAGFSGSAVTEATNVVNDANAAAQTLDKVAAATSVSQYQQVATASEVQLQQELNSLDSDVSTLVNGSAAH